jgi:hypothetical protein
MTMLRVLPAFGMTALVLGHIALLLFFLPVLGVPISAAGLLFGVAGLALAPFTTRSSLRFSVAGVAVCALALGVTLALYYAPVGYLPAARVPPSWQRALGAPDVPPPARPGAWLSEQDGRE